MRPPPTADVTLTETTSLTPSPLSIPTPPRGRRNADPGPTAPPEPLRQHYEGPLTADVTLTETTSLTPSPPSIPTDPRGRRNADLGTTAPPDPLRLHHEGHKGRRNVKRIHISYAVAAVNTDTPRGRRNAGLGTTAPLTTPQKRRPQCCEHRKK